jgi:predicted ATP-grasp superfamily ATP-dependent carboligase
MKWQGKRILVLEGYARQSLALVKAFSLLGCEVSALCSSKLDVCYSSKYTKHKILGVCDRTKEAETTKEIRRLLKTRKFDMVVPTVDFSAAILSKHKTEFSQYAKIMSNDWNIYQLAGDKNKTMKICDEIGIPHPKTVQDVDSIEKVLNSKITFPIVVKPCIGYGAIGFKRINSEDELRSFIFSCQNELKNYVFQEYIPQTDIQFECAMFVDNNNEVKTGLVFSKNRWFPIHGGSSTLNITVDRPDIVENCTKLLQAINWRGPADIDLIQDPRDGEAKIMEINPRVSGSVKITFNAGVDQARQMLELCFGKEVTLYKNYDIGKRLRCSQTDFLWFVKSPNRFKSNPSWFSNKNTSDQIFDLKDPLPWLTFSIQKLLQLKTEMGKRI